MNVVKSLCLEDQHNAADHFRVIHYTHECNQFLKNESCNALLRPEKQHHDYFYSDDSNTTVIQAVEITSDFPHLVKSKHGNCEQVSRKSDCLTNTKEKLKCFQPVSEDPGQIPISNDKYGYLLIVNDKPGYLPQVNQEHISQVNEEVSNELFLVHEEPSYLPLVNEESEYFEPVKQTDKYETEQHNNEQPLTTSCTLFNHPVSDEQGFQQIADNILKQTSEQILEEGYYQQIENHDFDHQQTAAYEHHYQHIRKDEQDCRRISGCEFAADNNVNFQPNNEIHSPQLTQHLQQLSIVDYDNNTSASQSVKTYFVRVAKGVVPAVVVCCAVLVVSSVVASNRNDFSTKGLLPTTLTTTPPLPSTTKHTSTNTLPSSQGCPSTKWRKYDNATCFYFSDRKAKLWESAKAACESEGGAMTSIHNQNENHFLSQMLALISPNREPIFFIGLRKAGLDKNWTWIDNSPLDYLNWHSGEPNNDATEHCVEMRGATWNNIPCIAVREYICKASHINIS